MSFVDAEKQLSAINLLEKIIDEQADLKIGLSQIGGAFVAKSYAGHMERILSIIGTSGTQENKDLRIALKELNMELTDDFPDMDTINFLMSVVFNRFYDAVGAYFGGWENAKKAVSLGAFGNYGFLNPELLGIETKKNKYKKRNVFRREKRNQYNGNDIENEEY